MSFITHVDNDILDEAVKRITRIQAVNKSYQNERIDKLNIRCLETRVDCSVFAAKYLGTIESENKDVYTYKNMTVYTGKLLLKWT